MNSAASALAGDPPAPAPASAAGTPPAPAPAPAPAPTPPAGGDSWYSGVQNPELKTWIEAKGFKDAGTVAESAWNLEKLIGHDRAGRTLVIPKDDAPPEEMAAFRSKLGVPDSADGYKLPVPEGDDGVFAKTAASWMHKHGIPPKQAEGLATEWNEFQTVQAKAQVEAQVQKADKEYSEVITSWGKDADQKLALGKKAAAEFIPAATPADRMKKFNAIELAIGTRETLEMFASMGAHLGEHNVQDAGGGSGGEGMTVAAAQARISALKGDKDWIARYVKGGATEKAEMDRLHKLAYPEA